MTQMAKLMENYVAQNLSRGEDQSPIEIDIALWATAPPAAFEALDADLARIKLERSPKVRRLVDHFGMDSMAQRLKQGRSERRLRKHQSRGAFKDESARRIKLKTAQSARALYDPNRLMGPSIRNVIRLEHAAPLKAKARSSLLNLGQRRQGPKAMLVIEGPRLAEGDPLR